MDRSVFIDDDVNDGRISDASHLKPKLYQLIPFSDVLRG